MANVRLGNTFYIDTQYSVAADELAVKGIRVLSIILTTTSTTNNLVLSDSSGGVKLNLRNVNTNNSWQFDFTDSPIEFANSIRPTTLTGCVATLVIQEARG